MLSGPDSNHRALPCADMFDAFGVGTVVLACQVHGECTLAKQLEGLKCCAACEDYEPSVPIKTATATPDTRRQGEDEKLFS